MTTPLTSTGGLPRGQKTVKLEFWVWHVPVEQQHHFGTGFTPVAMAPVVDFGLCVTDIALHRFCARDL